MKKEYHPEIEPPMSENRGCVSTVMVIAAIITFAMLACLFGCKSARSTTKTESATEKLTGSEQTKLDFSNFNLEEFFKNWYLNQNKNLNAIVYDTSKPVDENTGRPPVLADINSQTTTNAGGEEKGIKKDTTNIQATQDKGTESLRTSDKGEREEIKPTQPVKQLTGLVWALVGLGGVGIVWVYVYLYNKKKKTI